MAHKTSEDKALQAIKVVAIIICAAAVLTVIWDIRRHEHFFAPSQEFQVVDEFEGTVMRVVDTPDTAIVMLLVREDGTSVEWLVMMGVPVGDPQSVKPRLIFPGSTRVTVLVGKIGRTYVNFVKAD